MSNATRSCDPAAARRSTGGVSIAVTPGGAGRVITVNLSDSVPGPAVPVRSPIPLTAGAAGGTDGASARTVTAAGPTVTITLTS